MFWNVCNGILSKNISDRSNHLVLPGEMLSFQVLFQVTEQKEVGRCEVGE
jgi:hypothetical protein